MENNSSKPECHFFRFKTSRASIGNASKHDFSQREECRPSGSITKTSNALT